MMDRLQSLNSVEEDKLFTEAYLPNASEEIKGLFRAMLSLIRDQNKKISLMQFKADYFDTLVDLQLLTTFKFAAEELYISEEEFVQWLMKHEFIYRDLKGNLVPNSQYVPELFQLREWACNGKTDAQAFVTPKGKETFSLLLDLER